ncbi:MAG: M48 family metallopeptidase [Pseudomonadota bacterium]
MNTRVEVEGALFFDGNTPVGRPVETREAAQALVLRVGPDETHVWPLEEVRQVSDMAGKAGYVLRWTGDPLSRLFATDPAFLRGLPQPNRPAPPKGRARLAAWALAAVGAVAVQIFVLIPLLADNLAGFIPPEGERALGEATYGQIRAALDETGRNPLAVCESDAGTAALDRLVARLSGETDFGQAITLSVLDHEMINAFALPGGYVVLFRGLIEAAESPDEVAAVLAHEIGHVISRDPTRNALRSAGSIGVLGLLLGDFAGGAVVLFLTERLIAAQYSQAAEAAADSFAHQVMATAEIRPAALADIFERIREEYGDREGVASHFLSHPSLSTRIAAARAATDADARYTDAMSEADWAALQTVCDSP